MSDSDDSDSAAAAAPPPPPPRALTAEEHKQLGNEAFRAREFSKAVRHYGDAIDVDPKNAALFGNRAAAHIAMERAELADEDCKRALELDPKFVKAYGRQAKARWMLGKLDEASRLYEQVLIYEPKNSDARADLQKLAELQQTLGAYSKAFEAHQFIMARSFVNQLLQHSPGVRDWVVMKAECNMYLGSPEIAARDLRDVLLKNGDDLHAQTLRGKCLLYAGNIDMAMQHYRGVIGKDPDNTFAAKQFKELRKFEKLKKEGNDAFKSRQWQAAEDLYTQVLAIDPRNKRLNSIIHNNRAAARKELGRLDDAERDCSAAIAADETMVKAYLRRSRIRQEMEKWDEAIHDMERAAELDSANQDELGTLKRRAKLAKRKNFYKILGVARDADDAQIKRAYRKMAMEWHPDKWQNAEEEQRAKAEEKFKEIGEAFSILSDAQKRRRYDMGILDNDAECGPSGMGGMNPMDIFQQFGGMGGGFPPGFGGGGGGCRRQSSGRGGGGQSFQFQF